MSLRVRTRAAHVTEATKLGDEELAVAVLVRHPELALAALLFALALCTAQCAYGVILGAKRHEGPVLSRRVVKVAAVVAVRTGVI